MEKLMDTDPYNRAMPRKLVGHDMFGDTYPTCSTTCQKQTDCDDCPIQEAFSRLRQYEQTGLTLEEIAELKEWDTAKEPVQFGDEDEPMLRCPHCDENVTDLIECGFDFCPYCGGRWEG